MLDLATRNKKEGWGLMDAKNEFDDFFNRFFNREFPLSQAFLKNGEWIPRVDVSEKKKEIILKAEIPGCDPKDIDVQLNGRILTIKGEKKQEKEEKEENIHRIERSFGYFSRTLELPSEVDQENIDAAYKDGVLFLTFTKTKEAEGKKIKIRSGS